jgi:DNA-binding SARP family transcriptional activator
LVEVHVLGPLEAVVDGVPVPLGPPQQRALLALLALRAGEVVSRDRIVDELWGERPPATAAKVVQGYVSALRKVLVTDVVRTRSPGYVLGLEADALDLERFERLAAAGRTALADGHAADAAARLREALALWRGPPLADLGAVPFASGEAARLEELRLAALADRIEADLALGRGEVTGELDALVAEHPLHERLRRQHMLALYRAGRQAEALAAYQAARRALVDELGIEPSRELRELEQAILRQDPGLDPTPLEAPAPAPPPGRSGFVGRAAELAVVDGALDDALGGSGRLVLISGEPGIGKSRFAEELADHARRRGVRVCVGRCWEAGGAPPYWPWVQVLEAYLGDAGPEALVTQPRGGIADLATILPEVRELVPDLPAAPPPDSEGARFRVLQAVGALLRSAAGARPLMIGVDDLHAADAPSLLLLRFVAGQLEGTPLLIVGAYRDTEIGPELTDTLAEVVRESGTEQVSLRGLSGPDTSRLLAQTIGEPPTDDLAAEIHTETQGNPLFAKEIGRLLAAEGVTAGGRLPIPRGVLEALGRRLQRQSEECREVLTLASVVGREFDTGVLELTSGVGEEALFEALDEAADAGLVGEAPDGAGRLRFSHILVRDALYQDLPAPRRSRLHLAIGDALEELYADNPEPHVAELARHYGASGPAAAEKATAYAQRAGDRAAAQYGYEEAATWYATALELLETARSGDADRVRDLLLARGEALSRAGSGDEAREVLRRAAELAEQAGRSDQLARAAIEYSGRFLWSRGSIDRFYVPLIERALAAIGHEDSSARACLLARLAAARRDDAPLEHRVALAAEAIEIAERLGQPVTLAMALEGQWIATEAPENAHSAAATTARMIEVAERIGDKERIYEAHEHRHNAVWMLGDRPASDVERDILAGFAEELRQPAQRWHIGTVRTMVALMEGDFDEAEQLIDETARVGRRVERWNAEVSRRLALFVLRREQGRLAELADTMRRSVAEFPPLLRFACAQTHLEAELGRESEARAMLEALLALDLEREHRDSEWLFAMALLADPCARLADERGTRKLYRLLLPFERLYVVAPIEAVFGSMTRCLGVLATALGRYDDAERHFEGAIALERSMRARPWIAHAQDDLAAMLVAKGDPEAARPHVDAAIVGYRALGMETWAERAIRRQQP